MNLAEQVQRAGVVGAGGGGFPTHVKLAAPADTVIANGAECEPWITCDDLLMRERAGEIVRGIAILRHIASAERVLASDALHVGGRRALVWVHVVEGSFAAALAELQPLRPTGSFDPEVATDEGWILYLSGRPLEARQLLAAPAFSRDR